LLISTIAAHLGQVSRERGKFVFKAKKSFDLAQSKRIRFDSMKWVLDRIRRLTAVASEQDASGHEPIRRAALHQTESASNPEAETSPSQSTEKQLESKPAELSFEDGLKDIPGVTERMLIAFDEHGIRSVEDLAGCATDDLDGWSESKDGQTIRHEGILDRLGVSRRDCEAIIMNARIKAGWIS
jgi:predicted flap endonuclease-1-like 5' DNA nuclease